MARRLDELDYYALLGVANDASVDAIKAAFHAFARRYHPDRHPAEEASRVTRIYRRGTEAYRVLSHHEQRRAYDQQLAQGELRLDPERVRSSLRPSMPAGQTETSSKARPFVAKAEQALRAKDYKQAKLNFTIALGHDPDNEGLKRKLEALDALLVRRE